MDSTEVQKSLVNQYITVILMQYITVILMQYNTIVLMQHNEGLRGSYVMSITRTDGDYNFQLDVTDHDDVKRRENRDQKFIGQTCLKLSVAKISILGYFETLQ